MRDKKIEARLRVVLDQSDFNIGGEVEGVAQGLAVCIVEAAARYWEGNDPDDFGIQYWDSEFVVFGGTNRLVWKAHTGFVADRSYCTEKFLARYDQLGPVPGKED